MSNRPPWLRVFWPQSLVDACLRPRFPLLSSDSRKHLGALWRPYLVSHKVVIGLLRPDETVCCEVACAKPLAADPADCPAHVVHQHGAASWIRDGTELEGTDQLQAIYRRHVVADVIFRLSTFATEGHGDRVEQRLEPFVRWFVVPEQELLARITHRLYLRGIECAPTAVGSESALTATRARR